jgi:hypothetical protein
MPVDDAIDAMEAVGESRPWAPRPLAARRARACHAGTHPPTDRPARSPEPHPPPGHSFFLFRDTASGEVQVVYKRSAGGYGMLIAEREGAA